MVLKIITACLVPFIGTALGAATVFTVKKNNTMLKEPVVCGFASGVMMAASVWSLIIPSVEMSHHLGRFSFLPMLSGFWAGIIFLKFSEMVLAKLSFADKNTSGRMLFVFAVVLHNIPEGMAVGAALAGAISENSPSAFGGAFLLSLGIAIQNIPEGAIIALPLVSSEKSRAGAFLSGVMSGVVEPAAAFAAVVFASLAASVLPCLLGFAAGAMIYVCVSELLPKASDWCGVFWFCMGFSVMMVLDICFG